MYVCMYVRMHASLFIYIACNENSYMYMNMIY